MMHPLSTSLPVLRRTQPTPERLRAVLIYDPSSGEFTRRKNGKRAGSTAGSGYLRIQVDGVTYQASVLAWLYVYGEWPIAIIDHINCDPSDNRIKNLRPATLSQNQANSKRSKRNTSGFKGVSLRPHTVKWRAKIMNNGRLIYLGLFNTKEQAAIAYADAAKRLNGEFARLA